MIRKLCALGLVCGPIPLLVGILFGSKVFQYLIQNKIDKIIKSDKYSLEEKINLGITDKKLKIYKLRWLKTFSKKPKQIYFPKIL